MNNSDGPLVTVSKLKAHSNNVWLFYDVSASMFNKTVKQNHTEHLLNYLRSLKIDFVYYPFSHSGFNEKGILSKYDRDYPQLFPLVELLKQGPINHRDLVRYANDEYSAGQTDPIAMDWALSHSEQKPDELWIVSDGQFSPSKIDGKHRSGRATFEYILQKHKTRGMFLNLIRVVLLFARHTNDTDRNAVIDTVKRVLFVVDNAIEFIAHNLPHNPNNNRRYYIKKKTTYRNVYPNHYNLGGWFYVSPNATPMDIATWAISNQRYFSRVLRLVAEMFETTPELIKKDGSLYVIIHKARIAS